MAISLKGEPSPRDFTLSCRIQYTNFQIMHADSQNDRLWNAGRDLRPPLACRRFIHDHILRKTPEAAF